MQSLDPRFGTTGWWHTPTAHDYFSPVGDGLWEIATRAWHDPAIHSASKVSWGVPVANEHVESHFTVGLRSNSHRCCHAAPDMTGLCNAMLTV